MHDARLVCDWAIDTSRRLRQVASAEREYVSVDLMGRLMRFVKRDEAPQLAEFEAKALATLDHVDKIERKALQTVRQGCCHGTRFQSDGPEHGDGL